MSKSTYLIECDMCDQYSYVITDETSLITLFCPLCGTEGHAEQIESDEDE
jgi:hypothetical protein